MAKTTTVCCICGDNIDDNNKLDPCTLEIESNFKGSGEEPLAQLFFTHYNCIKELMYDKEDMILDEIVKQEEE